MQDLETTRLLLTPPDQRFAEDLFAYGSDPLFTAPLNILPMVNVDQAAQFLEILEQDNARGKRSYWVAVRKEDGRAVGTLGLLLNTLESDDRACEFGYGFAPCTWGTGLFQEASRAIIAHTFSTLGYDRIIARTRSDNRRAIISVEKVGFRVIKTLKGFYNWPDGKRDCAILQLEKPRSG